MAATTVPTEVKVAQTPPMPTFKTAAGRAACIVNSGWHPHSACSRNSDSWKGSPATSPSATRN